MSSHLVVMCYFGFFQISILELPSQNVVSPIVETVFPAPPGPVAGKGDLRSSVVLIFEVKL